MDTNKESSWAFSERMGSAGLNFSAYCLTSLLTDFINENINLMSRQAKRNYDGVKIEVIIRE